MDDVVMLAKNLKQAWRDLAIEVQKNRKIKFEMFDSTFSQTYSLLSKYLTESSLDKNYIELVAEAYLFANIKDETLDHMCLATFVLTERMLAYCAFGNATTLVEPSTIYIVEARRDILLDFNDVNKSISKLIKVFEHVYWKKINL